VREPLVVFDCVVFLQGLIKESGPAVICVERFEQGRVSLVISPEILAEVREVLTRSQLRRGFPLLTDEKVEKLIELLLLKGKLLRNVPKRVELLRDPDDEPYLNAAIEAGAEFLVTRDRDLLDLMDGNTREGRDFRTRFPRLTILNPVEFLKALETE